MLASSCAVQVSRVSSRSSRSGGWWNAPTHLPTDCELPPSPLWQVTMMGQRAKETHPLGVWSALCFHDAHKTQRHEPLSEAGEQTRVVTHILIIGNKQAVNLALLILTRLQGCWASAAGGGGGQ